ncbi:MAG: hypothetical protein EAY75_10345 [Bacteroidetes bacterium]|nr:MAG: hypothetical protein EAY75_10345 [Bacteroidota bacterium]
MSGWNAWPVFHSAFYAANSNNNATVAEAENTWGDQVLHGDFTASAPWFDLHYYYNTHPDLQKRFANSERPYVEALNHFLVYGINEGRKASPLFDIKKYVANYQDLQRAFGTDYKKAWIHYNQYGFREERFGGLFNMQCKAFPGRWMCFTNNRLVNIPGNQGRNGLWRILWVAGTGYFKIFNANNDRNMALTIDARRVPVIGVNTGNDLKTQWQIVTPLDDVNHVLIVNRGNANMYLGFDGTNIVVRENWYDNPSQFLWQINFN